MLGVSIVLFVVLLAVLFAVAAVTAGFGDLMRPVFQDARPVGLPESKVRPDDLEALRFNVVLRGYKMTEVDAVLHRMAREIAERDAVLAELRGEGRPPSLRPTGSPDEQPTELIAPYADSAWTSAQPSGETPADDRREPSGEVAAAPSWSPQERAPLPADEPTEALPGYQAGDATRLLPAVPDDEREPQQGGSFAEQDRAAERE